MIDRIKELINQQQARNASFVKDWERYKTKDVEIFHRQLPSTQKINNRINHDFVGVLVNTKVSHFLGHSISISFDEATDEKTSTLLKLRRYTAFDRVLMELGIQAGVFGYGICLAYIDSNGKFNFTEVDPFTAYFAEDLAFRIFKDLDEEKKEVEIIEAYDKQNKYFFIKKEENIEPLSEYKGIQSGMKHLFNDIPLFKFRNNKEELSETYRVRNNINAVDKLISDLISEIEQFRLAYIKFIGVEPTPEQIDAMIQTGALCIPGDNPHADVGFITKTIDIQGILNAIALEEKNIFKFAQTYDSHGDRTGYGQLTNLGIHFLMAPINANCNKTITYFKESLYKLFEFYSQTMEGKWLDPLELSFTFTLDTPRNILEESQIQQNLTGIVSTETRLKIATFVDDPYKEILRMETEQEAKSEEDYL